MKRALFLVLAFLLAVPAGGCLKTNTVDESGYVLAIGFDPGETFAYRVSFAVQKISTGSSEPSTDGFMLFSAEAENLFQAIETVSANAPYQLSFVRTAMLIFDQKLLEDAGRLSSIMNTAMERLRIRYNANVFVALDGAKKVLEGLNSQESPQSIDKLQEHFLAYARDTGMLPEVTFLMLYQGIRQPTSDAVIPLMGTNEDIRRLGTADSVGETDYAYLGGRTATQTQLQTGVAGLGLMEADRLVGILSGQNTQLLLMATGDFQTGDMQLPLPDGSGMATAAVRMQRAPKTELVLGEPPAALVRIHLEADLLHPEILGIPPTRNWKHILRICWSSGCKRFFGPAVRSAAMRSALANWLWRNSAAFPSGRRMTGKPVFKDWKPGSRSASSFRIMPAGSCFSKRGKP